MLDTFPMLRATVKKLLEHPMMFDDWTIQGFGMLRCYIPGPVYDKQFRLNIWDDRYTVPGVSTIHDHPWDFQSVIINGRVVNVRFVDDYWHGVPCAYKTIKTGIDATLQESGRMLMNLRQLEPECYKTGDTYLQLHDEIHRSIPINGSVTLNERRVVGDGEHARVFWEAGEWVDAKPRRAYVGEILQSTEFALSLWDSK